MVPPTAVTDAKTADSAVAVKDPVKDTILTPRFYTTDFEAMAAMDLRPNEAELEAICEEFQRTTTVIISFATTNSRAQPTSSTQKRAVFFEFLEQSCTSEFSGFLLTRAEPPHQEQQPLAGGVFRSHGSRRSPSRRLPRISR